MRIRVCIPYYAEFEAVKPGLEELLECREHQFVIIPRMGTYVGEVRNSLINDGVSRMMFQKPVQGFDAFLFIDSDISFTLNDVLSLIKHDKPIVFGSYPRSWDESVLECGWFDEKTGFIGGRYGIDKEGFQKVGWAGAGFCLVKSSVFEKLTYPWYRHILKQYDDGKDIFQEEAWEDIGFCIHAVESGYEIWCDFNTRAGHTPRTLPSKKELSKMADNNGRFPVPQDISGTCLDINQVLAKIATDYRGIIAELKSLREENQALKAKIEDKPKAKAA